MSQRMGKQTETISIRGCMERGREYEELFDSLRTIAMKNSLDNCIPAFSAMLGILGVARGAEKKLFISYVVGAIDRTYQDNEDFINRQ